MPSPPTPAQTVAAILAAQYKPLDYAQSRAQAQAAKEQAALQAANLALVHQLQGGVNAAAPAYDAAVTQTSDLARQAAQMLAAANPNQQIQGDLAAIGAPHEQQALLADQLGRGFNGQGAVLNVQQGSIPGASLVAQKAAEQGYLAGLPTVAALQGQQNLRSLLARSADSQDKYVEQRLGVAGQAASLLPQLLQQRTENQQADRSFGLQKRQVKNQERQNALDAVWTKRKFDADQAYRQAQINAAAAEAKAQATGDAQDRADANYWKGVAAQQNQQRIGIDRQRARAERQRAKTTARRGGTAGLQLRNLPDGSVVAFNPNTGEVSPVKGPSGSGGTKGLSQSERRQYAKDAAKVASRAFHGYKNATGDTVYDSYQEAMQNMLSQQIPLPIAQRALNAYWTRPGMHQPGEPSGEGRPLYSFQQRQGGAGRKPKPKGKPAKTNRRGEVRTPVAGTVAGSSVLRKP